MERETFYITISTHDSDTLAGTDIGGFDVYPPVMTAVEIGQKVIEFINERNERTKEWQ